MTSASFSLLFDFWGKAGDGENYHPAICHMIDVGQVVARFLDTSASRSLVRFFAEPFGGDTDKARLWMPLLAACHDIGKISPGFQKKREDLVRNLLRDGYGFSRSDLPDHGAVSCAILSSFFRERAGVDRLVAADLAAALGSHHGRFFRSWDDGGTGRPPWPEARIRALEELARVFQVGWKEFPADIGSLTPAWVMALAGLVSICDWLGSSEEHFPFVGSKAGDLAEYARKSSEQAARVLADAGFTGWCADGQEMPFEALFPHWTSRDLQAKARKAVDQLRGPGILVIEAPMGLGKTEAALYAAEAQIHRHGLAGMYFALPTQATSNQIFGRLEEALGHRYQGFHVDLHLLHQLSDLNADYRSLKLSAVSNDEEATLRASSWFWARKRGLLAPFGVGTIDQALLSVMNTRHLFVRLFGLGQKVVVFDEVHAYDTYVSTLLDRLIQWLGAMGSTVIILTATLPPERRHALIAAYLGSEVDMPNTGYPQILSASREDSRVMALFPECSGEKTTRLQPIQGGEGELDRVSSVLQSQLQNGGCAVWICNTVAHAQERYQDLKERYSSHDIEMFLLHARYPIYRRIELERDLLSRFGKDGSRRPKKSVLVATQVVEQSLDLDFDFMVTDLAPVDLMLQRAGRLHRHDRTRPKGLEEPILAWIAPMLENELPVLGVDEKIYERLVLLRTWLAIRGLGQFVAPQDITQLVATVYSNEPLSRETLMVQALKEAEESFLKKQRGLIFEAKQRVLLSPDEADPFRLGLAWLQEDAPTIHESLQAQTRLARPSVAIVCAQYDRGTLRLITGEEIEPTEQPSPTLARAIRCASVAIQRWEWYQALVGEEAPEGWRKSAMLRDLRLAVFDDDVLRRIGLNTEIILSTELGIYIREAARKEDA